MTISSYFVDLLWIRSEYNSDMMDEQGIVRNVKARNTFPSPSYRIRAYIQRAIFGYVVED